MSSSTPKLEENDLWRLASRITADAYGTLDAFSADEKFLTVSRLRQHAGSLADEIALAVGSIDPRDVQYYLGHARRDLFGIKSIYRISHDNGLLKLDPEQMVRIDKLLVDIDVWLKQVPADLKKYFASLDTPEKNSKGLK
jgi:hypothetical protein